MSHSPEAPNVFTLNPHTQEVLHELGNVLPPPTKFEDENLEPSATRAYRAAMREIPQVRELHYRIHTDLKTERDARGYLIIDGVPLGRDPDNMAIPTALGALVGRPFIMAEKNGFWQDLGVNFDAVPYRFQGTGENPFHIDAVNTTNPPDYFTFYGIRHDPQGGGVSMLSNAQDLVDKLSTKEIEYLLEPRYKEGQFHGMRGVGEEYSPFPVLQKRPDGLWWLRYTGKMLPDMPDSYDKELLTEIGRKLDENKETFTLRAGQLLIANQVIMTHGRTPLGPNQEDVAPEDRRYIRQSYIRAVNSNQ